MMRARRPLIIIILLMCIGAIMLIMGILGGELTAVFRKAIYICLECIGIG